MANNGGGFGGSNTGITAVDMALASVAGTRNKVMPAGTAGADMRTTYNEANRPRRQPRNSSGSSNLQTVFNSTAAAGGHAGTAASAGSYERRVGSAVKNPR